MAATYSARARPDEVMVTAAWGRAIVKSHLQAGALARRMGGLAGRPVNTSV